MSEWARPAEHDGAAGLGARRLVARAMRPAVTGSHDWAQLPVLMPGPEPTLAGDEAPVGRLRGAPPATPRGLVVGAAAARTTGPAAPSAVAGPAPSSLASVARTGDQGAPAPVLAPRPPAQEQLRDGGPPAAWPGGAAPLAPVARSTVSHRPPAPARSAAPERVVGPGPAPSGRPTEVERPVRARSGGAAEDDVWTVPGTAPTPVDDRGGQESPTRGRWSDVPGSPDRAIAAAGRAGPIGAGPAIALPPIAQPGSAGPVGAGPATAVPPVAQPGNGDGGYGRDRPAPPPTVVIQRIDVVTPAPSGPRPDPLASLNDLRLGSWRHVGAR